MNEVNVRGQSVLWASWGGAPVFVWELGEPQEQSPRQEPPAVELHGGPGVGEVVRRVVNALARTLSRDEAQGGTAAPAGEGAAAHG